jgi:heme exporter protein B
VTGWLRPALLIAAKDVRLELRTRDVLTAVGLFALLVVVVGSFAFPALGPGREGVAAGMLWMALLFAVLLGIGRALALEKEDACIEGLMAAPIPRESIFLGKLLSTLAFVGVAELGILPAFLVLLQLTPGSGGLGLLVLVTVLGTVGLATVGTLFAGIAVNTRTREAILPLLVVPIAVPVMIAAVKATETALGGTEAGAAAPWLLLLLGYSALFLMVSLAVFPFVLEE